MYDDFELILVERKGPVLKIVLNRPEARNAITYPLQAELIRACNMASDDNEVKVVTIQGAGKVFCAGHDLKEVASGYATIGRPAGKDPHKIPGLFGTWYCTKPIVAAVQEYCGPMGMVDILANCDFVLAAEGTRFSFEQARFGGGNLSHSPIVFQLPMRVWKKLCMVGGWFSAEQALGWDYVQRVVPLEDLQGELDTWAEQIAQVPLEQLVAAKRNVNRQYELMGLNNMAGVQNATTGHGDNEDKAFFQMIMDVGMREALAFRQKGIDSDTMRV